MAGRRPRVPIPLSRRLDDLRRGPVSLLVWLIAAGLCVVLLDRRSQRATCLGIARPLEHTVSARSDGTVTAVLVDLYQEVRAGDVLVQLDEAQLVARLDTARAELVRLRADLSARRTELERTLLAETSSDVAELRRFLVDEEARELDLLALRAELAEERIELERRAVAAARQAVLVEEGLGEAAKLQDLRLKHEALKGGLEEDERLLALRESALEAARARREAFQGTMAAEPGPDPILEPLRQAVEVQGQRLAEIEIESAGLITRAATDGRVAALLASPGQAVLQGQVLLTITASTPGGIMAWWPEESRRPAPEALFEVFRPSTPEEVAATCLERLGPAVEELPRRLWRNTTLPEHGRPLLLAAAPGLGLQPGETVAVRLASPPSPRSPDR